MHFRALAYLLCLSLLCFSDLAASDNLKLQPLPQAEVPTITGQFCGCITFPKGAPLTDENIIMSSGSYDGPNLVRIAGTTRSLNRVAPSLGHNPYVNKFASDTLRITARTHEVKYQDYCSTYSDPPPHGSCFLGMLIVKDGRNSSNLKILELCGC